MGLRSFSSPLLELFFILRKWPKTELGDCGVRLMWIRLSSVTHQNLSLHMLLTFVGIWIWLEALAVKGELPAEQWMSVRRGKQNIGRFFSCVRREEIWKGMDLTEWGQGRGWRSNTGQHWTVWIFLPLFFFSEVEIAIGNHRMQSQSWKGNKSGSSVH